MNLTIECIIDPDDNLELLAKDGSPHVHVTVTECGRYAGIELNPESATKLRDALTDWLGG